MALKQNNLAEATTELGFPAETSIPLEREVTLEDGTVVKVAGVTPEKLATDLGITYKTPGEPYITSSGEILNGVVQTYNEESELVSIAITTPPTKTSYTEGETFDSTGMAVTATYSDESTKTITDYTYTPNTALATTDTKITVSYTEGEITKTAEQSITVTAAAKTLSSISITTLPTKTSYTVGEVFDPDGMVVTAVYSDSTLAVVTGYTYSPSSALAKTDKTITISYTEDGVTKTATVSIEVSDLVLIPGKTYEFNYKALADYIEEQLTESGDLEEALELSIYNFEAACIENLITIDVGITTITDDSDYMRCGVIEGENEAIEFGVLKSDTCECGPIISTCGSIDSFSALLTLLKKANKVEDVYDSDFNEVGVNYDSNITINLENSGETETFTIPNNINWITQKD